LERTSQHNLTPEHFLGDALGSVRQLVDPAGAVTLAQSYAPYGDTLSSAGSGVSVYQYTGEARDTTGMVYLRARYLDSGVGRFISRDTWGGDFYRPLSLNRWGYVEANPINLTDPSGNLPCTTCDLNNAILAFFGLAPDYRGIAFAEKYVSKEGKIGTVDAIIVAAGIAVQSQWYGLPWDYRCLPFDNENSGLGIAQVSDDQMKIYSQMSGYRHLEGADQENPVVAVWAMAARIELVQRECNGCSPRDQLIAASMAQNGDGFDAGAMRYVYKNYMRDGGIRWAEFFIERKWKENYTDLRAMGHENYDTRFMLLLMVNDIRELQRRGWDLPHGITEADLNYVYDLSWGTNNEE
jgi:RHS repeat-associated protein